MNKKTTTKLAAVTEVEKFTKTVVTISALYVPRWLFISRHIQRGLLEKLLKVIVI